MTQLDKETQTILSDGEKMMNLVNSDGWMLAKKKLVNKMLEADAVSTIILEGKSNDQIVEEMKIKLQANAMIMGWLREIEGDADAAKSNLEAFREVKEEVVVEYFS